MERELMEKRLLEIFKQKYNQGDNYYVRVNNKGDKFIVGYKNDYPMQHGGGVEWMIPAEVVEMLVSQVEPEVILPERNSFGQWIDVKEKLPVYYTEVLVKYKFEDVPVQAFYESGKWYGSREVTDWMQEGYVDNRILCSQESITHWMPLPKL